MTLTSRRGVLALIPRRGALAISPLSLRRRRGPLGRPEAKCIQGSRVGRGGGRRPGRLWPPRLQDLGQPLRLVVALLGLAVVVIIAVVRIVVATVGITARNL